MGNKDFNLTILLLIIVLAFFLRLVRLTQVPPSLSWDEAAIGYNAYAIWKTGKDEFGLPRPLAFKSFGDYKSPLLIYLTAPFVGILGLNEFSVRFPSVLIGTLTVLVVYFLSKELFKSMNDPGSGKSYDPGSMGLLAALLLVISPWHLQFSRAAFEANLALFLVSLGAFLFLKALKEPLYFFFSAMSFILSLYSYHSPKLFLPFFLLALLVIFFKKITVKPNTKWLILTLGFSCFFFIPLARKHLAKEGAARFIGTAIFFNQTGEKIPLDLKMGQTIASNYLIHFSPQFLFWGSTDNLRNKLKRAGPLYLVDLPFLFIGLVYLLKNRKEKKSQLLLFWLILAPIPAALVTEAPHSIRSLNMLIPLIIILALGLKQFFLLIKNKKYKIALLILYLFNFSYYLYHYHFIYPFDAAPDWQYGHKEMVLFVQSQEKEVDKIIITSSYGQPHIFVQFFQKLKPLELWQQKISQYQFRDINWDQDRKLPNSLIVATEKEVPKLSISEDETIVKEIHYPDGSLAFRIIKT